MLLILIVLFTVLPILLSLYLLYTHSQSSLTPFTFFSYSFETQQQEIKDAEACVLMRSETQDGTDGQLREDTCEGEDSSVVYMSLIVPAYNEENRIERMLTHTLRYCRERHAQNVRAQHKRGNTTRSRARAFNERIFTFEIIVVDDGSKDKTRDVVMRFIKDHELLHKANNTIRFLPLVVNRGKGFAVKQGVMRARGQRVLMLDADGATEIEDMEKLERALDEMRVEELKANDNSAPMPPFNAALGSRRELESDADRHWFRDLISRVFNLLVRYISGIQEIKDTQCGFKMFDRAAARYLFINQHCERWCFDIDILILCQYHKQPRIQIREVPIRWKEIAGSHLNIWGLLGILRDLFLIRLYYVTGLWGVKGSNGAREYASERGELWIEKYEKAVETGELDGTDGVQKKRD